MACSSRSGLRLWRQRGSRGANWLANMPRFACEKWGKAAGVHVWRKRRCRHRPSHEGWQVRQLSEGCATLALHLRAEKIGFTTEYKFHPTRHWRADFCLPKGILVEVDGAIWTQGRHTRGLGFEADMDKLNEAALLGWRVLRFSTGMVKSGKAIATIRRAMG